MKKSAFESFKFGQNKTKKQTYFPSVAGRAGTIPNFTAAKKVQAPAQASNGKRPAEK